ncbi:MULTISPECIES: sugar ABC transporter permease [unclassified Arthrobacter]|uniref:carbohydrate ABC transporter permease n=2 Tax=Arthrobacter TaxID=1663 RepID=UPI0022B0CFF2|nr:MULTISPECIES: sugar ABC transporter permease [unclassified Arthrobacter]MDK1277165.1 sugar ABC transporter permease [Arthrobacter sp. zg.Y919]WIB03682.1 sugar ABC transporter permease [Arthrobacter sp. zg-Y919]
MQKAATGPVRRRSVGRDETTAAGSTSAGPVAAAAKQGKRKRPGRAGYVAWLMLLPALAVYVGFVVVPLGMGLQYSFYDWNGVGVATFAGLENYLQVVTDPELLGSILNALTLIIYFTLIPIGVGLILASLIRSMRQGLLSSAAQTILFLPQIVPLAAAGIAWSWMYAQTGTVNQFLSAVGLGGITRSWLADYGTALPAVGLIGSWVLTGLCTVLLLTGIGKIDSSLYEAVRLDGAGWWREFFTVTLPGLRQEIAVLATLTIIAALSSFDIIYTSTQGGPGRTTLVPGISIFRIGFTQSDVGLASAFGIVLMVLVLLVVLPIQRLSKVND